MSVETEALIREDFRDIDGPVAEARSRRTGWISVAAGVAVLALALLPPLFRTPFDASQPLVVSMPTLPTLSWTAAAGEPCAQHFTDHHMILSDTERVWSLDLRDGTETWSTTQSTPSRDVVCLPGANLLAFTDNAPGDDPYNTTLLDGSTGRTIAELPSSETVQVLPLGEHIGLVSPENVLSLVTRERLQNPKWTRDLSGEPELHVPLWPRQIGEGAVQLSSSTDYVFRSKVVSLDSGRNPAWFLTTEPEAFYNEIDGVVLGVVFEDDPMNLTAFNQSGEMLWNAASAYYSFGENRLYLIQIDDEDQPTRVVEVDPRTGNEVTGASYEGDFYYAESIGGGRLAVHRNEGMTLLDEHMEPRVTIGSGDMSSLFIGEDQVLILESSSTLAAISTQDYSRQWTLELEGRQEVLQMGQHLVVLDGATDTIRGLSSTP